MNNRYAVGIILVYSSSYYWGSATRIKSSANYYLAHPLSSFGAHGNPKQNLNFKIQ